jgi:hypothetical protein
MAVDAGAQQILDLLNAKSAELTDAGDRLRRGVLKLPKRRGGVAGPITFAALDDARRFYEALSAQIASIETISLAKGQVLSALAGADQSLAAFEQALHAGINRKGARLVRGARKRVRASANELKAASEGLSA